MRWNQTPQLASEAPQAASLESQAKQALKNIKNYNGNDDIVLKRLLDSLHKANEEFAKENKEKSDRINLDLAQAIANEPDAERKGLLTKLNAERMKDMKVVEQRNIESRSAVVATTASSTDSLREAKSTVDRLANLDGNTTIDRGTKDIVDEHELARVLSYATAGGDEARLKAVYKQVTGNDAVDVKNLTDAEVKDFQSKLRTSLIVLNQLGGGNAGLNALLLGKTAEYMKLVADKVQANGGKPLQVKVANPEGLSPQTQTLLGAAATIGAAVVTGGILTVGHEAENMNADAFIKRVQEKGLMSQAGSVLAWIKDAFMGRKLSLTFFKDKMSVDDFEAKVVDFTKEVMALDGKSGVNAIKNPELKKMYPVVLKVASDAGVTFENGKEKIQKALIQAYIQDLGTANQGSDWTLKLGLLFI